jgi:hypothetical protein
LQSEAVEEGSSEKRLKFTGDQRVRSQFLRQRANLAVSQTAAQILCIPTGTDSVIAAAAANEVSRGILLLKIPHCGVRRQQD